MVFRYNLSSISVNASSPATFSYTSGYLRNLGREHIKNLDCYFAIMSKLYNFYSFKPISE